MDDTTPITTPEDIASAAVCLLYVGSSHDEALWDAVIHSDLRCGDRDEVLSQLRRRLPSHWAAWGHCLTTTRDDDDGVTVWFARASEVDSQPADIGFYVPGLAVHVEQDAAGEWCVQDIGRAIVPVEALTPTRSPLSCAGAWIASVADGGADGGVWRLLAPEAQADLTRRGMAPDDVAGMFRDMFARWIPGFGRREVGLVSDTRPDALDRESVFVTAAEGKRRRKTRPGTWLTLERQASGAWLVAGMRGRRFSEFGEARAHG